MNFNEYQKRALTTDVSGTGKTTYHVNELPFLKQLLGLVGETGEFADKIKKILRDKDGIMTDKDRAESVKELGDILWYLAVVSSYLGVELEDVARQNIKKLTDRAKRGVIKSQGDNR